MSETKTECCSRCKKELPITDFYPSKTSRNKLQSFCIACCKEYVQKNKEKIKENKKEYYEQNKEKTKENKKEYYKQNKEKIKEDKKEYYKQNKEKIKEDKKTKYYPKNKEHIIQYQEEYRENNKEKLRQSRKEYNSKTKLRSKNTMYIKKYNLSLEDYYNLVELQQNKCLICGNTSKKLVIDHDHITNKVRGLLCDNCNLGLGHFKDDCTLLQQAIYYLTNALESSNIN